MNPGEEELTAEDRRGPIAWMVHHAIAGNLLMMALLGGGIWAAFSIQKEVFPEFQLDIVRVSVEYPGASPSEVDAPRKTGTAGKGLRRSYDGSGRRDAPDVLLGEPKRPQQVRDLVQRSIEPALRGEEPGVGILRDLA